MALLEWNDQFSVSISELDDEHKKLVAMLNSLHDAMKTGKGKERVTVLLDELVDYTVNHFAHEERLMKQYQYPMLKEHKEAHENLVQQVLVYKEQMNGKNAVLPTLLVNFLRDWIINHIGSVDKRYSAHLSAAMK